MYNKQDSSKYTYKHVIRIAINNNTSDIFSSNSFSFLQNITQRPKWKRINPDEFHAEAWLFFIQLINVLFLASFPSFEYTQLFKYRIKANLGLAQRDELSGELKSGRWGVTTVKGTSEWKRERERQTDRQKFKGLTKLFKILYCDAPRWSGLNCRCSCHFAFWFGRCSYRVFT